VLTLRPDQAALLNAAMGRLLSGCPSLLLVAPTGWGKTCVFSALAARLSQAGKRVFILVHRAELLDQVSATLTQLGVEHGCIAPERPNYGKRLVQVASVFTLARRLADYRPPDLCIIDEAHHAIKTTTWGRVLSAWHQSARLGVTATPERLSGEGLRDTFDSMLAGPSVKDLIAQGHLSDYRLFAPPVTYTEGIHRRMGDYDKRELSSAVDKPKITGSAVEHYLRIAEGKRALVFCVSISHAHHVAETFKVAGLNAQYIDGKMGVWERRSLIERFRTGGIRILTSCDLISEGFDLPAIEVAILLRPTQSLALYLQQVGRALRPYPGKPYALILDHAGNALRHGLPDDERQWSLEGREKRLGGHSEASVGCRTCGHCFAAVRSGTAVCPYCQWVFPIESREVEQVDGGLEEIDRQRLRVQQRREVGQAKEFTDLLRIQHQRGYRSGWAWHVQQARARKRGVGV
jgi:superfamily II DNA or RNA helicase